MAEYGSNLVRRRFLVAGFIAPALLVIGISLVSHQMASESTLSYAWVDHTYRVLGEIDHEMRQLVEAEAGVRGFVLTGQEEYLAPKSAGRPGALVAELAKHTASVEPYVTDFQRALQNRYAHLETTIDIRRSAGFEKALARIQTGEGRQLSELAKRAGDQLKQKELQLLEERKYRSDTYARWVKAFSFVFLAVSIAVLVLIAFLIVRLQRLQNLVKVCAWTQRIQYEGKWVRFEEYLEKRFGVRTTHGMSADAANQMRAELDRLHKPKTGS